MLLREGVLQSPPESRTARGETCGRASTPSPSSGPQMNAALPLELPSALQSLGHLDACPVCPVGRGHGSGTL